MMIVCIRYFVRYFKSILCICLCAELDGNLLFCVFCMGFFVSILRLSFKGDNTFYGLVKFCSEFFAVNFQLKDSVVLFF